MFWSLSIRLWWFVLLTMVGLAAALYLVLSRGAETSITEQLLDRELIIARADAGNIESFFQAVGNSIALQAQMRSMERMDSTTAEDLDAFVNQWRDSGLVTGIVLTNSRGVVTFNSNVEGTHDVDKSLADRDYFAWARNQKKEGDYFVGVPVVSRLGASKGQVIVTVASPVFAKDVFWGVVIAAVKLAPLAQRYLELMKVSDLTDVYLIDQGGGLLYSSPTSQALSDNLKKALINTSQEGQLQKEGRLIAFSPVKLSSQSWLLIVASPIKEVFSLTVPFYIKQVAALLFLSCGTLLFGVMVGRKSQNKL